MDIDVSGKNKVNPFGTCERRIEMANEIKDRDNTFVSNERQQENRAKSVVTSADGSSRFWEMICCFGVDRSYAECLDTSTTSLSFKHVRQKKMTLFESNSLSLCVYVCICLFLTYYAYIVLYFFRAVYIYLKDTWEDANDFVLGGQCLSFLPSLLVSFVED